MSLKSDVVVVTASVTLGILVAIVLNATGVTHLDVWVTGASTALTVAILRLYERECWKKWVVAESSGETSR